MNSALLIQLVVALVFGRCSAYLKLTNPSTSIRHSPAGAASGFKHRRSCSTYNTYNLLPSQQSIIQTSSLKESVASSEIEAKDPTFGEKAWKTYLKTTDTLTTLFPLWTVLFAGVALLKPSTFAWFSTKYFTASLGQ